MYVLKQGCSVCSCLWLPARLYSACASIGTQGREGVQRLPSKLETLSSCYLNVFGLNKDTTTSILGPNYRRGTRTDLNVLLAIRQTRDVLPINYRDKLNEMNGVLGHFCARIG